MGKQIDADVPPLRHVTRRAEIEGTATSFQRTLVESSRLSLALSIDDLSFRNLLLETGVLSTKEETKWSFGLLFDLIEGPLKNPKRLEEVLRASKFMKRVLGYFWPFNLRFSDTKKDQVRLSLFSAPSNVVRLIFLSLS
jgi:hypothetical protein